MHLGPVLEATLQALAQLHQTKTGSPSPWRLPPVTENRQEIAEWIAKASYVNTASPLNLTSLRTYGSQLTDRMAAYLHTRKAFCTAT